VNDKTKALFPTLTQAQIDWLTEHGVDVSLADGEVLFAQGKPAEQFYVVLEGDVQITKHVGRSEVVLTVHRPGGFTGELSLLTEGAHHIATGRAVGNVRVIKIPVADLRRIVFEEPDLAQTILTALACRVQEAAELVRQREKLAALGKLSAGLAHELNNPAAAVLRSVQQLQSHLTIERALYRELTEIWADPDARRHAQAWVESIEKRLNPPPIEGDTKALPPPQDGAIERSEREERLTQWLETHDVRHPWQIAAQLSDTRIEPSDLEALASGAGHVDLTTMLAWATAALTVDAMVVTAQQSARRVTELVAAIKTYSHMDEADYQEVDIHDGLESTLTILTHEWKHGIEIRREYDRTLPRIGAFGSELNQVWTNLIDDAVDAVREAHGEAGGVITLRTAREGEYARVEVIDNGSGIDDALLPRIFDPFFTTKGVGEGTGLGLEIAYQIIVRHHNGDIRAVCEDGQTRFEVRLPIHQPGR